MSQGNDAEAKTLPPTARKLKKAREKGQIASSSDFVSGVHVILGVLAILLTWKGIAAVFASVLARAESGFAGTSPDSVAEQTDLAVWGLIGALLPMLLVLWIGAFVSNVLHKKGIPFSLHPITPDFGRLSPARGFQKIFSGRNATEFGVSALRLVVWFAAVALVLYLTLGQALFASVCGIGCVARASVEAVGLLLIAAAILLLVAGLIDLPLQFALFNKEQKMSLTEMRREQKEQLGTPEMRSYRRERGREMLEAAVAKGRPPVLFLSDGHRTAVGLFFDRNQTPIPVVTVKAQGALATQVLARAEAGGIPVEIDADLALELHRKVEEGGRIREKHFEAVAMALAKAGAFA